MNVPANTLQPQTLDVLAQLEAIELRRLFGVIREQEHSKLPSLDDRGLTQYQGRVNIINEMEHMFIELSKQNR